MAPAQIISQSCRLPSPAMSLIAHLRNDFIFARRERERARFRNRMRQRLLAIHMLAGLAIARIGGGSVMMIRNAHRDGVQTIFLFQHDAVIAILPRVGPSFCRFRQRVRIHVTNRHDVFARKITRIISTPAGGADDANIQLLVWRFEFRGPGGGSGERQRARGQSRGVNELAAIQSVLRQFNPDRFKGRFRISHGLFLILLGVESNSYLPSRLSESLLSAAELARECSHRPFLWKVMKKISVCQALIAVLDKFAAGTIVSHLFFKVEIPIR